MINNAYSTISCQQDIRRPAVAASLHMQGLCQDSGVVQSLAWCMILNPNKTKALVVSRSRTVNPNLGDLVLSDVSIYASPKLDIFGVKFDRMQAHIRRLCAQYRLPCLSKKWYFEVGEACLCGYLYVAPLLCICSPNPKYCSPVQGSAAKCHLQLLERQVYSVVRLLP